MSARPEKHSLTLRGHRTSVSLESAFWDAFREMAAARGVTLNQLAAEIDAGREGDVGLASAIRLHVLAHFRALASGSGAAFALRGGNPDPSGDEP